MSTPKPHRIIRHEVPVDGAVHDVPWFEGDVLHVDARSIDVLDVWVLDGPEHPDHPAGSMPPRRFTVVGTGHPFPDGPVDYAGTALSPAVPDRHAPPGGTGRTIPRGALVWHLLEVTRWVR